MRVLILFVTVISITLSIPVQAENNQPDNILQAEKKSAFKGLFYKVWNKFKTMSPKDDSKVRKTTVTMGIRGAETTSTILQPYWKDDKTSDKQFMQQLEDFAQAQTMADKGDLAAANQTFGRFMEKWPESDLKPNAQFAEALTMGAMGKAPESSLSFKAFIEANPEHPLVQEAKTLMKELK